VLKRRDASSFHRSPSAPVIEDLIGRGIAAGLFPGGVAAWGRGGQPPAESAAGWASLRPQPTMTHPGTLYDLASLTKPLAVVPLFLVAQRSGRLTVTHRVGAVLPELDGSPVGQVSCQSLLTHTSGLPAWWPLYAETRGDPSRTLQVFRSIPLRPPRDDGPVVYSCLGYILLGFMLERVFDRALRDLFIERIARPLGLENNIGFLPAGGPIASGAHAPDAERELLRQLSRERDIQFIPRLEDRMPDDGNARFLGGVSGNAGLFGTARAVFVLASQFIASVSRLLSPEEIRLATSDFTPRDHEQGRGLGWQLARSRGCSAGPALSLSAFGHTGFTGTSVWIDPEDRVVSVFLANRHHPAHRDVDLHPFRRRYNALVTELCKA